MTTQMIAHLGMRSNDRRSPPWMRSNDRIIFIEIKWKVSIGRNDFKVHEHWLISSRGDGSPTLECDQMIVLGYECQFF